MSTDDKCPFLEKTSCPMKDCPYLKNYKCEDAKNCPYLKTSK